MAVDSETGKFIWYWATTVVLALGLFFPILRFIWVKRVRRLEGELKRVSTDEERGNVKKKSRLIAGLIAVAFAYIFNTILFGP